MKKKSFVGTQSLARYIRVFLGLSQAKLAAICGLTKNDISRFERGDRSVGVPKIIKLAAFFGVTVNDLAQDDYTLALPKLRTPRRNPDARKRLKRLREKTSKVGDQGEALVAKLEKEKLADTPYAAGVNAGFADELDAGFDILSFRRDGTLLYIEVKSTTGRKDEIFYMSACEKAFLEYCVENKLAYELHRVYDLNEKGNGKRVIYSAEEVMNFTFGVDTYAVRRNA